MPFEIRAQSTIAMPPFYIAYHAQINTHITLMHQQLDSWQISL